MKNNFQSKSVPRGTRTIWRYLSALFLLFTLGIGQMWADLTAHVPGVYEKTVATGGYGCTLTTVASGENAGTFEVYYFSAQSKYSENTTVYNGGTKQQYRLMCADSDSEYQLINRSGTGTFTASCDWIEMAYATTGFSKSDYTFGSNKFNEFFEITPNGGNTGITKTCYIKPKEGDVLTLKVSGYVEFAILGADNGSSKYMTITVDGGTPTSWKSNTLSRRSVELTTGEHTIVVANVGTSANNFYGFSLKVPSCSTEITTQPSGAMIAVGDANPELSIVATNVASYAWKESSDGTSYDGASTLATTADYTPSVNDAEQTKYYYCEVTSSCDGAAVSKSNIVTVNVVGAISYYTVTLNPAGGTIVDATGWTLNAGNYEKEVAEGTVLTLPTFTKTDRAFKTWRKAGPADVASPVTVDGDLSLTAIWTATIEQVIYSWEGAEGGAIETGGTASSSTDGGSTFNDAQINVKQAETELYCLQINGNNSFGTNLVQITLAGDEKVKTGDKIKYWGFYSKSSSANARPKMRDANGSKASIFDDPNNLPNLYSGGEPAERTFTVPASINTNAVQITRSQTGSSTWIPKLQIIREVQVEEGDLLTVTFDANGGSAIAPVVVASGQAVAKPTDPTWAHHRFNEWQLAGSAYDFSSAVTTDITLVANWTQLYTISFAAGDGSGDAPAAIADKAKDETFEVPANTFTAPASKEFDKWNDGTNDYAPGATYTVGTANVVLTAQWKAVTAKYTVIFKDGETTLDTKLFEVGSNPSDADIDKTKPLFAFAAWQKDAADIALDDEFWATVVKDATVTLTARWTAVYALDVNFKDAATQALGVATALNTYHYASDASDISFEEKGLKIKTNAARFYFNVAPGKVAEIKFGNISGATYSVDGGAAETLSTSQLKATYSASAQSCVMTMTTDAYNIVENVVIHDPYEVSYDVDGGEPVAAQYGYPSVTLPLPIKGTESFIGWFDGETKVGEAGEQYTPTANITLKAHWESISTDARLSSITFSSAAGTLEPAFDPEVVDYTYTMPYPTAAVPTITGATSVSAKAQDPEIVSQAAAWNETAVIRGVAESGDKKTYNITMKIAPKDGVSIIKVATTGGTNKTVTGLYAGDGDVNLSSSTKMDGGKYIGFSLDGTTLQAGDRINVHTTTAANTGGSHIIFYDNMTDKNELYDTEEIGGTGDNIFEINAAMVGSATAYVYRANNDAVHQWNGYVDFIEVTRAMNPVLTAITLAGVDAEPGVGNTFSALLPNGTNLASMTVVPTIYWNGAGTAEPTAAWDWGENTFVVTDKDGDATTYTITLTEDVLKHTVTYYDGATELGTENVEHGEHPTAAGIVVPSKLGSTFQGWSETDGGAVVDLNDITINADDELYAVYAAIPCPTSGTVYKFEIKDGLASENLPIATDMDMSSYIDATGIGLLTYSATANNKATINSDGTIQLKDATAAYLKVELACALAAGDQIRAHVSNNPIRVQVGTTYDSSKDLILDKNAYDIVDITAAMEGLKVLYIARSTNGNANLADFEIYRRPALTGASLADLTMRQGQNKTPELTLEPSADAIVTSQVWEIVGEPTNLTDAAINGTTGVITTGTLDNPANNGTLTVKVTLNGSIEATCTVTVVDAIVQADVTKSTIWDWHNTGAAANIQLTNSSDPKKNENFVLANVAVNNNASFESDKLAVEGEYMVRDYNAANPYFQGQLIQFHTTVAGVVRVKFSHTGSNKPARELFVNGVGTGDTRTQATGEWSRYVEVPAGDVSLTAFHVDPADGAGQQYIRIFEIEFLEKLDSRTEYAAGELGTACYEYDAVVIGATPYMVAGVNGNGYIVFDEITSGVIDAGYPYLFEAAGGKVFFCKPVGTTAAPLVSGEETSVKGMIGTFSGTTLTQGEDDICYFAGRHIWRVNDFGVDIEVEHNRCYVNYDVLRAVPAAPAAAPGRRRVIMGVNGKDAAQGIEDVQGDNVQSTKVLINGNLYILRGEKVFDATGRLVK